MIFANNFEFDVKIYMTDSTAVCKNLSNFRYNGKLERFFENY